MSYHQGMSDLLLQERDGPLLTLTLNDPERANPLSPELVEALSIALDQAAVDPEKT